MGCVHPVPALIKYADITHVVHVLVVFGTFRVIFGETLPLHDFRRAISPSDDDFRGIYPIATTSAIKSFPCHSYAWLVLVMPSLKHCTLKSTKLHPTS